MPIAAVLVALAVFSLYKAINARRTLDRVEKMLKDAMEGDFNESEFTEDRTSKLESTLADYLRVSNLHLPERHGKDYSGQKTASIPLV